MIDIDAKVVECANLHCRLPMKVVLMIHGLLLSMKTAINSLKTAKKILM